MNKNPKTVYLRGEDIEKEAKKSEKDLEFEIDESKKFNYGDQKEVPEKRTMSIQEKNEAMQKAIDLRGNYGQISKDEDLFKGS